MDDRFVELAALAAENHAVFTTPMARSVGVSDRLRHEWLQQRWIERLGLHTFRFAGGPATWHMALAAALGDCGKEAALSGRSSAALLRLDGFGYGPVEVWTPRSSRHRGQTAVSRSSAQPLLSGDVVTIDGLRCVTAERVILDSLLFQFTDEEINNAIDSAIRMRLVSEKRLRRRVLEGLTSNVRHRSVLIAAFVDTGGESALERRFLARSSQCDVW